MAKIKKIKVKNYNADVSLFLGQESFKIAHLLQQTLLPAISNVFGAFSNGINTNDILNQKIDISFLQKSIKDVFENLGNEEETYNLIKRILSGVVVYASSKDERLYRLNSDNDFDELFAGQIELVYLFVLEVLKVNYPFFLAKIKNFSSEITTTVTSGLANQNSGEYQEKSEQSQNSAEKKQQSGLVTGSILADILQEQK